MVVGWLGHGRRKTYLDSSRGLIAMTVSGQVGVREVDKKTACACGGMSLGQKRQLMKAQVPESLSSAFASSTVHMDSRSKERFFFMTRILQ